MVLYNLYAKRNGRVESTTAVTITTTTIYLECRSKDGGGDEDDDVVDDFMKMKNRNVLRKIGVDECDEDLHPATGSMYIKRMKPTPPFILQYWTSSCSFSTCTLLRLRPYSASATATADFSPSPSLLIDEFTTFCYQRDLPRAMKAMESMQKHQLWADSITYSELIKCCLAHHAIHHGRLIHKHLFSHGHRPATFLINILLNMYVKFNLLDDAQALFDQMPHRNVVSWTTLISAYANANAMLHHNKALQFLIFMLRDGVRPNMFTYSSVLRASHGLPNLQQLHSSIIKTGLDSDVFVRSALIDIYSKWGELHNSLRIFDEMVTADLVVWNSIIGGFAQNTDGDEALNIFKRMKRAGFWADQGTLTSVLRACTGLALLELGRQIHVHVLKFNQDLILNNALLDMYCKCGSLEDANSIFSRMVETDVVSWSTMIMGLAQNGFSRKALQLFESMKASGTKPNYITILGVLFACSHAGLVEDGQYYFQSMNKCFGIDPGREHYGCMVDLLGRAGKLDEAVKLIHEMECEPDTVTWRALLGACRVHRNTDLAIYAAKKILNLEPNDAGTYILLSNIYANSQRWEDVAEVRRAMRGRGVGKEPGCSWIEVDKQIHAFILGDKSHPQIGAIRMELDQFIWRLKELGYVPDTNFVLQDLEGEQKEDSLSYHSEKLAIVFGMMSLSRKKTIRIRKNLRICGDCHVFAKLVAKMEHRNIVIRDPIHYHHFRNGICSCGDYW
ncbi:Pentatricopeptide repeat-containing protein [Camellia lanceoleosa]|uniref:Pentatricopeptide repeat-containing protein n=1 Tax=Camellia lanceoleosa TaxID=1840588 RepID=A0ACC0GYP1_9ERIC|nr:Pentatricopeptide repeat-containing protein [Camellia lanceoleosa]